MSLAARPVRTLTLAVAIVLAALAGVVASAAPARAAGEGVIQGTVTNWLPEFSGTQVEIYVWDAGTSDWELGPIQVGPLTSDLFSFPVMNVPLGADYSVLFLPPSTAHALPTFLDGTLEGPSGPGDPGTPYGVYGSVVTNDVEFVGATFLSGTVRNSGGHPVEDIVVLAEGQPSGTLFLAENAPTGSDGTFTVKVPGGEEYSIAAVDIHGDYWEQIFRHLPGDIFACGCGGVAVTSIDVAEGDPDSGGYDFELHPIEHVQFDLYAEAYAGGPPTPYSGLTVHLYKKVSGGWIQVESDVTHSGVWDDGFVAVYGPGAGTYRLRFSIGGTYVAALPYFDYRDGMTYPPQDAAGCYLQFSGLDASDDVVLDLSFDPADTRTCGPQKVVTSGGGGGGGSPGVGTTRSATSGAGVTPTATATPTPTPTPTTTATAEPSPEPSVVTTPTPDPTPAGDTGFPWWIILIIVIVAGIVILILVLVLRR